jgi:hypothetical protein
MTLKVGHIYTMLGRRAVRWLYLGLDKNGKKCVATISDGDVLFKEYRPGAYDELDWMHLEDAGKCEADRIRHMHRRELGGR